MAKRDPRNVGVRLLCPVLFVHVFLFSSWHKERTMALSHAAYRYGWIRLGLFKLSTLGEDLNLLLFMFRCFVSRYVCLDTRMGVCFVLQVLDTPIVFLDRKVHLSRRFML